MPERRLEKIEHLQDLFLLMIHKDVQKFPKDGEWRKYEATYQYGKEKYDIEIEYRFTQDYFSYCYYKVTPHTLYIVDLTKCQKA